MKKFIPFIAAGTVALLVVSYARQKQVQAAAVQPQNFLDRAEQAFNALWPF